jgi:hypothetical protein
MRGGPLKLPQERRKEGLSDLVFITSHAKITSITSNLTAFLTLSTGHF